MTGHWPVVKDSDFAQPVPRRMRQRAVLAASSTAPGSPVTYRPGMPSAPAGGGDVHQRIEHGGRRLLRRRPCPWPRASKPTRRRRQSTSGTPRICSIWSAGSPLRHVDGFAAEARAWASRSSFRSPTITTAAPEQLGAGRRGQPDRTGAGNVDGGPDADACGDGPVETGREDVREHGQVHDLLQRLVPVGEPQQVPVRVGDQDVLRLPADPSAHVDVAVGGPGTVGVHVQADPGLALLAVPAAPAGDVERHRTMSPTLMNSTSGPVSMTSPVISCPRTRPAGAVVRPRTMCWSDPQMLVLTVRRMTPCGTFLPTLTGLTPGPACSSKVGIRGIDDFHDPRRLVCNGFVT